MEMELVRITFFVSLHIWHLNNCTGGPCGDSRVVSIWGLNQLSIPGLFTYSSCPQKGQRPRHSTNDLCPQTTASSSSTNDVIAADQQRTNESTAQNGFLNWFFATHFSSVFIWLNHSLTRSNRVETLWTLWQMMQKTVTAARQTTICLFMFFLTFVFLFLQANVSRSGSILLSSFLTHFTFFRSFESNLEWVAFVKVS